MSNEITVRIKCTIQEIFNILENKGFSIIDKYNLEDIYYIQKNIDVQKQSMKEILKKYILIRNVTQYIPDNYKDSYKLLQLTFKSKDIALDGTITSQQKKDCQIQNMEQGKEFLKALDYKELMFIKEKAVVYAKGELKLVIKDIEDSDNLIEIETIEKNPNLDTVEKLKERINELNIPIDTNDYFVKKAEIVLKKLI